MCTWATNRHEHCLLYLKLVVNVWATNHHKHCLVYLVVVLLLRIRYSFCLQFVRLLFSHNSSSLVAFYRPLVRVWVKQNVLSLAEHWDKEEEEEQVESEREDLLLIVLSSLSSLVVFSLVCSVILLMVYSCSILVVFVELPVCFCIIPRCAFETNCEFLLDKRHL